ncbi:MAG: hypothetical protein ACQKBY_05515 [Verrucomicrobiales bacterium]
MIIKPLSLLLLILTLLPLTSQAQQNPDRQTIENSYHQWRQAMINKDARRWQQFTAHHRQIEIRNRAYSERRQFPANVFDLPVAPPDIRKLKALSIRVKGPTAKAIYFGKVDFGVGGEPTDNLLVVSFLKEGSTWKYALSEFINLSALPAVRQAIVNGDNSYINQPDFMPDGTLPRPGVTLTGPVPYIAKVYAYCPGREVTVQVNRLSRHLFQNTQASEVVIGGARDGENQIEFKIKNIPGGTGQEALTVRVYLMSEVPGVKPVKAFEYLINQGQNFTPSATQTFTITPEIVARLMGRQ